MSWFKDNKKYSTVLLRVGIALVFLWFGLDKFFHTINWIGWVPEWMKALIPISMNAFMYSQGAIESLTGSMLLIGYKTRLAAFVASATLVGVAISLLGTGQTEVLLRDFGLLAASLSLLLTGSDYFSVDSLKKK